MSARPAAMEKVEGAAPSTLEWAPLINGRTVDYGHPAFETADLWTDIAVGLSHLNRFGGQTPVPFTVAQHSVQVAEAAEDETGDMELAAFCLLHDAHETPFGEFPSPSKQAISDEIVAGVLAVGGARSLAEAVAEHYLRAHNRLTDRLDAAILIAAHLDPERYQARKAEVKRYDLRALQTERLQLCKWPRARIWAIDGMDLPVLPLRRGEELRCWKPALAAERFSQALTHYCPAAARAAR